MVFPAGGSSGGGVRLRVAGIPVRFDTWFFIIGILLSIRAGLAVVVLWLVVLGGSVLVHELGHALVARTTGAQPEIVIHALGGLTTWLPPGEVSRSRRVAISLAGPGAGIALGLIFVAAEHAGVGDNGGLARLAIYLGIRVNILYGLFNLLPILPLDGGQTLRDLLPGADATRERTAAVVSVVVGAGAIAGALALDEPFAAVFVALFVAGNVASLRGERSRPKRRPGPGAALAEAVRLRQSGDPAGAAAAAEEAAYAADQRGDDAGAIAALQLAAVSRLDAGDPSSAKRLLLDLPAGSVDPVLEGRVLLATGQPALGVERLAAAFKIRPSADTAYHLAVALVQTGGVDRLLATFGDPRVPFTAVLAASLGARSLDAFGIAGRLAELAGSRAAPGAEFGQAAFTAAGSWARAGERDRALLALRAAVQADARYAAAAAADEAFWSLRGPDYDEILRVG